MKTAAIVGWDIGGAHVKAALLEGGRVRDAVQWPCPLWQGMDHLDTALAAALERWPGLEDASHAVTMTGELVDLFEHREQGVARIAAALAAALPGPRFFGGDAGWFGAAEAGAAWRDIASANWRATARHCALALASEQGLLVDVGSTTTDLVAFAGGRVLGACRSDADRLAEGELVYHGVVRTPLCAFGPRIAWRGRPLNVMNEIFATSADVYRLTGELDPAHDQQASADRAPKDAAHSRARLARMIGLDARDADAAEWLEFARAWRGLQLAELRGQVERVAARHGLGPGTVAVAAGCGGFLVAELIPPHWRRCDYAGDVARPAPGAPPQVPAWAGVGAAAVAVAALAGKEWR
ncbi:MAG: H4MPT-linked C1 transfer pathway protein [Burkholderiales bacterium]|nr:H4MPT-linked C1 transfer pathway protein [Burkholderiales bacterium]